MDGIDSVDEKTNRRKSAQTMDKTHHTAQKKSFAVIPWPKSRGGPQVMLRRFVTAARQHHYTVRPSWLTRNTQPCLFIGHTRQRQLFETSKHLVYRVAGMFLENHFRRMGEAFGDRSFRPEYVTANQQIREALIRADFVIYQSTWSKRNLDTLHQRPDNTWDIIPNAVPLQHFAPADDWLDRTMDRPLLGTVGFLRSRPRLEVFFDVARRLPIRPRLLLIGKLDTYCQETLARAQADPYWQGAIRHVPSVPPQKLVSYYQEMDCLVHAVVGDACPNVVVEALACGIPVVCPLEGGTAELLGAGGIAAKDTDIIYGEELRVNMAKGIETVLEDLTNFKRRAREQAEKNNDVNQLTSRYLQALGFPSGIA